MTPRQYSELMQQLEEQHRETGQDIGLLEMQLIDCDNWQEGEQLEYEIANLRGQLATIEKNIESLHHNQPLH